MSIIGQEFCFVVHIHLLLLVFVELIPIMIAKISIEFEETYEILFILGAIDGSHIPIVVLKIDSKSHYHCKGLYSTLT